MIRSILGFGTIAIAVLAALHVYAWRRLVRDVELPKPWRRFATLVLFLLALVLPAVFVFGRRVAPIREMEAAYFAYLWLGLLFYLFLLLLALDLIRLGARLGARLGRGRNVETVDPVRRRFLARAAASTAILGSGTIAALGNRAVGEIETPELAVALPNLPRELSGFRIAHLSDIHIGPISRERFLESVVEKTNAQRPDLVVITGDLVDASVARLAPALAPLAKLRARHGVVFVTGNHEYYSGAEDWIAYLRSRGIRVLQNERVAIGDAASFDLAGIPDHSGGRFRADHRPDVGLALEGRDPGRGLVLLAHQPRDIALATGRGVGLQLSGHTHGGQLWPFGALVSLYQPWIAGLHRADDGTQIYVSRGTGFWGPPMRVGNPAEIASIVLTT